MIDSDAGTAAIPARRGTLPGGATWREHITVDRAAEFFDTSELSKQIGHGPDLWPAAILKELIDNGLDAAETVAADPEISVTLDADTIRVGDNGGGIPAAVVTGSLDYRTRTTDKIQYVAPTRGRQGNALKCVWAAPFVSTGVGSVDVEANGQRHLIRVERRPLDPVPAVRHEAHPGGVKTGSLFALRWPEGARSLAPRRGGPFYAVDHTTPDTINDAAQLVTCFGLFNPHASFTLSCAGRDPLHVPRARPGWRKWRADQPSPVTWYTVEQFTALLATHVRADEAAGRKSRSVREFVATFKGLTGTQKPKAVFEAAGLGAKTVRDLFGADRAPDGAAIGRLYEAMVGATDGTDPRKLGVIGREAFLAGLGGFGTDGGEKYKFATGTVGGVPWVLEVGFAVRADPNEFRLVVAGVNWSPALRVPFDALYDSLAAARVDDTDPAVVGVHLAFPGAASTDRGKTRYQLPDEIDAALADLVGAVARDWRKVKVKSDRNDRRMERDALDAVRHVVRSEKEVIKDAAYGAMAQAYRTAAGSLGMAAARQVMYAARPLVLEATGGKCWKDSKYFTQTLLPNFIAENPEATANWDVVFDDRGHFREPHTGHRLGIGTVAVREYLKRWDAPRDADGLHFRLDNTRCPTSGPTDRFKAVLFVEKQGFDALLDRAQIDKTYDVALMSTKGMTVTAARLLFERLTERGVRVFVLHDFDKSGFAIVHTARTDNRRYVFKTKPDVVDIGLRLGDVAGLQSEPVDYDSRKDPKVALRACGATEEECAFLVRQRPNVKLWRGERVELNALTSDQLLALIHKRFAEHGVAKVVPDAGTLAASYQRAVKIAKANAEIKKAVDRIQRSLVTPPPALAERVAKLLKERRTISWDQAVAMVADEDAM